MKDLKERSKCSAYINVSENFLLLLASSNCIKIQDWIYKRVRPGTGKKSLGGLSIINYWCVLYK